MMCCACNGTCNHVGPHSFCTAHGGTGNPFGMTVGLANIAWDEDRPVPGSRRHLAKRIRKLQRKLQRQGQRLLEAKYVRDRWRSLAGDLWSELEGVEPEARQATAQMYLDEYERLAAS